MHQAATMLMHSFGGVGRALPAVRGRGRLAIALTSLLLKAGADPIVQCKMAAGHRLRLDCRVPGHCWAFFSGNYDDEKRSALLSFLRPGGAALDVGANIGFYTIPMAVFAEGIGARVLAVEPVAVNTQWLRYNLALNDCADVVDVFEVGLADECGEAEIVLAEDFLAGGMVGNATIASRELYGPQFSRAMVRLETLDRIWAGKGRIDAAKVDIEGHEAKFLQGGRKTIASHRPVILMEVSRYHHERRGVDFDAVIPLLLPDRYAFAELRSGGIVQIENLAQCTDTDVLAIPEERLHEIDQRQWRDRSFGSRTVPLTFSMMPITSPKRAW
jgi:FkbM family methyltransferase